MYLYVSVLYVYFKAMFFLAFSFQIRDFISRSPGTPQSLDYLLKCMLFFMHVKTSLFVYPSQVFTYKLIIMMTLVRPFLKSFSTSTINLKKE